MSAFGWNERISELEKGKFNCPNCRRDAGFVLIELRSGSTSCSCRRCRRADRCGSCVAIAASSTSTKRAGPLWSSAGLQGDAGDDDGPSAWPEGAACWPSGRSNKSTGIPRP